jgi:hypothetical protein
MPSKMPPVPPENRSPKGTGAAPEADQDTTPPKRIPENLAQEDRYGNIKQNTTPRAHQQDQ